MSSTTSVILSSGPLTCDIEKNHLTMQVKFQIINQLKRTICFVVSGRKAALPTGQSTTITFFKTTLKESDGDSFTT